MEQTVKFLYEIGSLRKIARSHRQSFLTDDTSDNIASHSFRVSVIGYLLAKIEGADAAKVTLMCLLHDIGESRSGDQNWIHKRYVKVFEDEILHDQLDGLTEDNEPFAIASEYAERQSLESKIAKDADRLDQALLVQEYIMAGNQEAKGWYGDKKLHEFYLESSKEMYKQIIATAPSAWWRNIWTRERRKG